MFCTLVQLEESWIIALRAAALPARPGNLPHDSVALRGLASSELDSARGLGVPPESTMVSGGSPLARIAWHPDLIHEGLWPPSRSPPNAGR